MHRIRLLVPLLAVALLVGSPGAHASSSGLVVSQVYGGGGNSGRATRTTSFEIFNGGSSAANLTAAGRSQYASAASKSWSVTRLGGSIQPGHYYLVQLASSGSVGAALPSPDTTGTSQHRHLGWKGRAGLGHEARSPAAPRTGVARRPLPSSTSSGTARQRTTRGGSGAAPGLQHDRRDPC